MPTFHAISKTQHAGKRFKRYTSYAFAAQDAVVPLVQQEIAKACMQLPIAFIAQGEQFVPVALQSFAPGKNLLVAPNGSWAGGYIPAAYRGFPFALLPNEAGTPILCFDADSGLLSDTEGEPFFDEAGQPTQAVQDILGFVEQVSRNRQATQATCQALAAQQLLQPWPLKVQTEAGEQAIEGLFRIDEAALGQLDAAALKALQASGALAIAYMQLLSMQHTSKLAQLAQAHAEHARAQAQAAQALPTTASGELDLEFLNQGGTLNLSGL